MFDNDYDDIFDSDFNNWFYLVEPDLPKELALHSKDHANDLIPFYRVYSAIIGPLTQGIYQLLQKQYPRFREETRAHVISRLAQIARDTASSLLLELFKLIYNQACGVNIREIHTHFDNYVKHYGRPGQPQFIGNEYRYTAPGLTDEEWAERLKEINNEIQQEFDDENTPKVEFIDLLQSFVIGGYPALEDLNPDEWILYGSILHYEFREYQDRCWLIDSFIAYNLPESDLSLSNFDLEKKIVALRDAERAKQEHQSKAQESAKS